MANWPLLAPGELHAERTTLVGQCWTLLTTEVFAEFAMTAPAAAKLWLERLARVTRHEIKSVLDEVPAKRMTNISKEFTLELLLVNQERLLKEQVRL